MAVFNDEEQQRIRNAVATAEKFTTGELRVCIEKNCSEDVLDRAAKYFLQLEMHKTRLRNGVLIYLLLADHAIEIIADRGLTRVIPANAWEQLVQEMGTAFHDGHYEDGMTQALAYVTALLHQHFATDPNAAPTTHTDELPDAPVRLHAGKRPQS